MSSLAIVIPLVIVGTIVWVVVGMLRQRAGERFTLATAAAFYSHLMTVVGTVMVLAGAASAVKVGISYLNPAYSYYIGSYGGPGPGPNPAGKVGFGPPANYLDIQREQDVILAIVLLVAGVLVVAGHYLLARLVRSMPGGQPPWITRGTLVALTVVTGLPGILTGVFAAYAVLVYFIVGQQNGMTFGDAVGTAAAFLPAWVVAMTMLVRQLRPARPAAPTVGSAPATEPAG